MNPNNEAGAALLKDGALRWNRKRQGGADVAAPQVREIFDSDVLADIGACSKGVRS